jgi:hypothetical protein
MAKHSPEANKMRRDLEAMRAAVSQAVGREQAWDATESKVIDLIVSAIDRKCALQNDLDQAADAKARVKLAAEVRLTEAHIARLVKQVQPKMPKAAPSTVQGRRAQRAGNMRWGNVGA